MIRWATLAEGPLSDVEDELSSLPSSLGDLKGVEYTDVVVDDAEEVDLDSDRSSIVLGWLMGTGDFMGLLLIAMPSFPDPGDAATDGMNFLSLFNRTATSTS
jgi:hypothetical protein